MEEKKRRLQEKESEYIFKKYAEEALNSWLKNLLFTLGGISASLWFCIQIYKNKPAL